MWITQIQSLLSTAALVERHAVPAYKILQNCMPTFTNFPYYPNYVQRSLNSMASTHA